MIRLGWTLAAGLCIWAGTGCMKQEAPVPPPPPAPAAPANVAAIAGANAAYLSWNASPETDVVGYYVYRSETQGAGYAKVFIQALDAVRYSDYGVVNGITYYYRLTAIDARGNESEYSSEVSVTPAEDIIPPATPTGLVASLQDANVRLDWDDNGEVDFYRYEVYRAETEGDWNRMAEVPQSWFIDQTVTAGTQYYYAVIAVDYAWNYSDYSASVSIVAANPPPAQPVNLVAVAGDGQVSLDWSDNTEPNLSHYNVYRSTTTGTGYARINAGPVQTSGYIDLTPRNWVTYYYVVTAVDTADNESTRSAEATATIPDRTPPAMVTGFTADARDGEVVLTWTNPADADLAAVIIKRTEGAPAGFPVEGLTVYSGTGSICVDGAVANGTTYYYTAFCRDEVPNYSAGSAVSATLQDRTPPGNVADVVITVGEGLITLAGTNPADEDLAGVMVRRSTSGYPTTIEEGTLVLSGFATGIEDPGLANGTTYYYTIFTRDISMNYSSGVQVFGIPGDHIPPVEPAGLVATYGHNFISLTWIPNSEQDLVGYNVYRSTNSGNDYVRLTTDIMPIAGYTDFTVTGGQTYYYVVTALDAAGNESGDSMELTAILPDGTVPAVPTGLTAVGGDRQVTLDWADNADADLAGYNVYRSHGENGPFEIVNTGLVASSAFEDSGVENWCSGEHAVYWTAFADGLPQGWTVSGGENTGFTWRVDNPGQTTWYTWGITFETLQGTYLMVDQTWAYETPIDDASLLSPEFDCSRLATVTVNYSQYFQWGDAEYGDVDVRINGGGWQNVKCLHMEYIDGAESLDISTLAAGKSNVQLRWHYHDSAEYGAWGIDNFVLKGSPISTSGVPYYYGFFWLCCTRHFDYC